MRVSTREQAVGELVHLAFKTVGWKSGGAALIMLDGTRCGIPLLESGEGKDGLQDGRHVAAEYEARSVLF